MALAGGEEYYAFPSLEEAQRDDDGIAILEGGDASQIYVVAPAAMVKCSGENLSRLLYELEALAWSGKDPDEARIFYERHRVGDSVPGGVSGGRVTTDIWVHPQFERFGMSDQIKAVVSGASEHL